MVEYTMQPNTNAVAIMNLVHPPKINNGTIDSGAKVGATDRREFLHNYRPISQPVPIGTAKSGDILFLRGIGDLVTTVNGRRTIFRNIFYCPGCASTLISLRMLTRFGRWRLIADSNSAYLEHLDSHNRIDLTEDFQFNYEPSVDASQGDTEPISRAALAGRPGLDFVNNLTQRRTAMEQLQCVNPTSVAYISNGICEFRPIEIQDEQSYCKWHRRLGHQNANHVRRFAAHHGIAIPSTTLRTTCETCAISKICRKLARGSQPRAENPMDKIHVDVIGPFKPISRDGYRYSCVIVDCHTRESRTIHQPTNSSAATLKSLQQYCTEVQGHPKVIQVDGGKEFYKDWKEYCRQHEIRIDESPPYAHHLNGVVERKVRTIKEMTRCLLDYSQLPATFWSDAMNCACYILNRSPSRGLPKSASPFFMKHQEQPKIDHLRIFGCKVIFRDERTTTAGGTSKAFAPKGREGIFIGYEENHPRGTYKIFATDTHQIHFSNNVQFLESQNITHTNAANTFKDIEHEEFHVDEPYNFDDESDSETEDELPGSTIDSSQEQPATFRKSTRTRKKTVRFDPANENSRPQLQRRIQENPPHLMSVTSTFPYMKLGVLKADDATSGSSEQQSEWEALQDPVHGPHWRAARERELNQFDRFNTYNEVHRCDVPASAQILPVRFIRKRKRCGKYKYRLVVMGNHQLYDSSAYAPTAALSALRLVMASSAARGWRLRQLDVSAAYLQSPIDEDVYVEAPPPPPTSASRNRKQNPIVWKLNKAMYGLRKSPRYWYETVRKAMTDHGLAQSDTDQCVYSSKDLVVGVWVDDFIYGGSPEAVAAFESYITERFPCDDPSDAESFCGINIEQSHGPSGFTISIHQNDYIQKILRDHDISPRHVATPLITTLEPSKNPTKDLPFREILGCLMYVMTATRPDISFAVGHLSRFGDCYDSNHYAAVIRLARYLANTPHRVITYNQQAQPRLEAQSDANWAGCHFTRKSTSGRIIFYGGGPVSWSSKLQQGIATSSCESELYALTDTVKEVLYLRLLLEDINALPSSPTTVECDNQATVAISSGRDQHMKRLRHLRELKRFLDIRRRFILSKNAEVKISYCQGSRMIADLLTKPLGAKKIQTLANWLFTKQEKYDIPRISLLAYYGIKPT